MTTSRKEDSFMNTVESYSENFENFKTLAMNELSEFVANRTLDDYKKHLI